MKRVGDEFWKIFPSSSLWEKTRIVGLTKEFVVVSVSSDPKPQDPIRDVNANCPIV